LAGDFFSVKIQFVDINADGKTDLAFAATNKKTLDTHLYFLPNRSASSFDFDPEPVQLKISINQFENFFFYDINKDGLVDILIGKTDGSLQYLNNNGPASSPLFGLFNSSYQGLGTSISRFCVSPTVADIDHDGKLDLVIANSGSIVAYYDFRSNSKADTLRISNELKNNSESRSLSSNLTLTTADLYSNLHPLVVAGTITGGVLLLKADSISNDGSDSVVKLWPIPVSVSQKINVWTSQNSMIQFFNVVGQKLSEPVAIVGGETTQIDHTLSPGFYFAKVTSSGKSQTVKFIVR
jgi:hypothetical protein